MRTGIIIGLLRLFALLPLPLNHLLGATIGHLLATLPNALRRHTRENLRRCFPDMSSRERRHLARRSLVETGKTITETGPMWFWPAEKTLALLKSVENRELPDSVMAAGKGLIFATPHLGCWEMAGLWGAAHYPMTTIYRRPRLAALDAMIRQARERLGTEYVAADAAGVRALYHALAAGRTVGMLPDQDPGTSGGIFAPFFGIPAFTMVFLSRLANKTRAPVVFAYCERLPWGRGYKLHFLPAPDAIANGTIEESVAAVNQTVEDMVRALPEQYQWSYQRFRATPEDIALRKAQGN